MTTITPRPRTHRLAVLGDDERRDLILGVTADLFAVQGFGGTSIRQIADELDIRASSLYTYYPSKRDLLDDLALITTRRGMAVFREAITLDQDVTARIIRGMDAQVGFRLAYPSQIIAVTREIKQLSPHVRAEVLDQREQANQLWVEVVEKGMRQGRFFVHDSYVAALILTDLCSYVQVKTLWVEQQRSERELMQMFSSAALKFLTAA